VPKSTVKSSLSGGLRLMREIRKIEGGCVQLLLVHGEDICKKKTLTFVTIAKYTCFIAK
jgi:hypothetical protein